MNRKKLLLLLLLALFAATSVVSYIRMPRQQTTATLKYKPGTTAAPRSAQPAMVPQGADENRLHLELLDQQPARFGGYKRNLFKPVFFEEQKILPMPPPPPQPKPLPVQAAKPGPAQPAPPPLAEPTPVQRDMANFTFLGFLKKGNNKTIFLSSNKEIFLARKGDKLAGKYEVANVTDEVLVIHSLADGGEIVIPLIENKPLAAPAQAKGAGSAVQQTAVPGR
jgi:hypothetical protein